MGRVVEDEVDAARDGRGGVGVAAHDHEVDAVDHAVSRVADVADAPHDGAEEGVVTVEVAHHTAVEGQLVAVGHEVDAHAGGGLRAVTPSERVEGLELGGREAPRHDEPVRAADEAHRPANEALDGSGRLGRSPSPRHDRVVERAGDLVDLCRKACMVDLGASGAALGGVRHYLLASPLRFSRTARRAVGTKSKPILRLRSSHPQRHRETLCASRPHHDSSAPSSPPPISSRTSSAACMTCSSPLWKG